MLHTVTCNIGTPYWDMVFKFIEETLQEGKPKNKTQAVIFNTWGEEGTTKEMASITTRAFLRHAYGCYYRALSMQDLKEGYVMNDKKIYASLLRDYTRTVRALGVQEQRAATAIQHTNRKAPHKNRLRQHVSKILLMGTKDLSFTVSPQLLAAEQGAWEAQLARRAA